MNTSSRMGGDEYNLSNKGPASYSHSVETSSYMASLLVEEMSNAELAKTVDNETRANRQLFLENDMFERYLHRAEPQLLANMEQLMQQAALAEVRQHRMSLATSRAGSITHIPSNLSMLRQGMGSVRNSVSYATSPYENKMPSASPSFARMMTVKEGPTINVSHKCDMATREMEELRFTIEHLKRVYTRTKAHLKADIEEKSTMVSEIQTSSEEFTDKVIVKGVEPLTKRIPAAVFVRFLDEWFKKQDLLSGQLRLRTNTNKTLFKKLSAQLEEKIELGESLNPVDFDFQEIQKLEVSKQLVRKNSDLMLLKTDTANTHREYTAFRDHLAEQVAELTRLTAKTHDREKLIQTMCAEEKNVQADVAQAEADLERIQRVRKLYTVPDVVEYARVKDEGRRLAREMKTWNRRASLQHKELISTRQKFKRVKEALEAL